MGDVLSPTEFARMSEQEYKGIKMSLSQFNPHNETNNKNCDRIFKQKRESDYAGVEKPS